MVELTQKEIKDILSIVDRADLSDDAYINEDNFEYIFDRCWGNGVCRFDSGVSKGVLFLDDYPNIVVKIPFTGGGEEYYRSYYTNEDGDTCITYNCCSESFDSAWQSLPSRLEDKLIRNWDYCEVETILFNDARKHSVDNFFAETIFIGYSHGHPVYVQEKARIYEGEPEYEEGMEEDEARRAFHLYHEIKAELKEYLDIKNCQIVWMHSPSKWVIDFYLYYGIKEVAALWKYLEDTGIEDLHASNVGYINHRPVITDYASFNS